VLAAGAGTRLRPLTDTLPKPLAPVAGRPVAAHLLEQLATLDLDAIAVNLHHGADLVERCLGAGAVYLREEWLRGTAGALAGAARFLRAGGDFLVASADGLHEIDLASLIARHRESGAAATITVKRIAHPETCAVVELDGSGFVRRFVEKPPEHEVFDDLASIGVYCFSADVLGAIPDDRPFDIAGELIPALLGRGDPIAAYATSAWWSDIGTPEELLEANLAAAAGDVRVRHAQGQEMAGRGEGVEASVRIYAGSVVEPGARVEGPAAVGPDAEVGPNAVVRRSLVLPGARVPAGAVVEDAMVGDGAGVVRSWLRHA
jgi:NDP-sugar pyrophosphorylase family protein